MTRERSAPKRNDQTGCMAHGTQNNVGAVISTKKANTSTPTTKGKQLSRQLSRPEKGKLTAKWAWKGYVFHTGTFLKTKQKSRSGYMPSMYVDPMVCEARRGQKRTTPLAQCRTAIHRLQRRGQHHCLRRQECIYERERERESIQSHLV